MINHRLQQLGRSCFNTPTVPALQAATPQQKLAWIEAGAIAKVRHGQQQHVRLHMLACTVPVLDLVAASCLYFGGFKYFHHNEHLVNRLWAVQHLNE